MGCLRVTYCTRVKVDVPNSVTYLNRTPIFEWYVDKCGSKNGYQKNMCLQKYWLSCSKYDNQNSQHNWGGDYIII